MPKSLPLAKFENLAGALVFVGLAVYSGLQFDENSNFFLLAFRILKLLLIAFLFVARTPSRGRGPASERALAYASTFLPFAYSAADTSGHSIPFIVAGFTFLVGEIISVWGLVFLGKSFGISPALRTTVRNGPYRVLSHPVYLGYAVSEISLVLYELSPSNILVLALSLLGYLARARAENRFHKKQPKASANF